MTSQAVGDIGEWLTQCVRALVPEWCLAMFAGRPLAKLISFVPEGKAKSGSTLPLSFLTTDVLEPKASSFSQVIDAEVPSELFLSRTVRIPKDARSKVAAIAELDLKQRTPFSSGEIYWQLDTLRPDGDALKANQWVVKRSDVELWQARLDERGYRLRQVRVLGAKMPKPIADFSRTIAPRQKLVSYLNLSLFAAIVLLAIGAWLYPAFVAQRQTAELRQDLASLTNQAVTLRDEVYVLQSQDDERAAFIDLVLRRPLLVETLRELTAALPDEVWVSNFSFTPQRIVLTAETSGSAAEVTLGLAKRPALGNPRLSGTVQRTNNGAERFELTIDLKGAK